MRTLVQFGALLSFAFFALAGLWMVALGLKTGPDAPIVFILAFCLLGAACFLGPLLWLMGEKHASKPPDERHPTRPERVPDPRVN